jgi:hypothetical protein
MRWLAPDIPQSFFHFEVTSNHMARGLTVTMTVHTGLGRPVFVLFVPDAVLTPAGNSG